MIRVYEATERTFSTSNGIKILHPLSAVAYKEDNGDYFLSVSDVIGMIEYYVQGNIIVAATPWGEQAFRIGNVEKNNGKIVAKCWHVFYDSENYVIKDSYVDEKSCSYALDHLNSACDANSPFNVASDIPTINSCRIVRKSLYEAFTELTELYNGHLERDNFKVSIMSDIGADRGQVISYKKNLTSISAAEDWNDVCTKILPTTTYDQQAVGITEIYLSADVQYAIPYTKCIRFDNEFPDDDYKDENGNVDVESYLAALETWLRKKATEYLEAHKVPKVNYTLSAYLGDKVDIGDTIVVRHEPLQISINTRVLAITYDCIHSKYKEIEFGNFKNSISNLMSTVQQTATDTATEIVEGKVGTETETMRKDLQDATNKLWDAMGGYVIKEKDRILVLDALPKENAKNVILINKNGIGLGTSGIDGTFNGVLGIDGKLDFKNVTTMNLVADLIKGGTLKLGGKTNGCYELYDANGNLIIRMDNTGMEMYTTDGQTVKLNAEDGLCGFKNGEKYWWADGEVFHTYKSETQEITIAGKLRFLEVSTGTNTGVAVVVCT